MKSLVVICGPTASGKTALVEKLAEYVPVEVISADSRQVYKEMDIGTAKPPKGLMQRLPHHVVDVVSPAEHFSASRFVEMADAVYNDIVARGRVPVLVGGTGLYIRALEFGLCEAPEGDEELRTYLKRRLEEEGRNVLYRQLQEVDPVAARKIPPQDTHRLLRYLEVYILTGRPISAFWEEHRRKLKPRYRMIKVYLDVPFDALTIRIQERCRSMLEKGLLEEVDALVRKYGDKAPGLKTIGYREFVSVIKGVEHVENAFENFVRSTRAYARRQKTWFKKEQGIMCITKEPIVRTLKEIILRSQEEGYIAIP